MATKTETTSIIAQTIQQQRNFFESGATRNIDFRIEQLTKFKKAIQDNEDNIYVALNADFKKSKFESFATEIGILYEEISCMLKNIKKWATPQLVTDTIANFPSKNYIYPDPYGVC